MTTTAEIYVFTPASSITKFYLNGSHTAWSGSSTPWTAQSTSPYEIGMNDVVGRWTPQSVVGELARTGGYPFSIGSEPVYKGHNNITETVPLQIRVRPGHPDDAITLKLKLWRILNTAMATQPCGLAIKPDAMTRTSYYLIYKADIQETEGFINDENGTGLWRGQITWERSPFASYLTGGEVSSNLSYTDSGASGLNVTAFSTSFDYGELNVEGQPMDISFTPGQNTSLIYLASCDSVTYSTTGAAALSTSSTTGTQTALNAILFGSGSILDLSYDLRVRARSLMRFSANTSNVQIRVEARGNTSGTLLYYGPWITPTSGIASIVDMGRIPLDLWRKSAGGDSIQLYIGYRSTNGASATTTLTYSEFILYYEWCRIDTSIAPATEPRNLTISALRQGANVPINARLAPTAASLTSTNRVFDAAPIRGTVPRWHSGKSLYAAWQRPTGHTAADTATIVTTYAPLWTTFRGADGS